MARIPEKKAVVQMAFAMFIFGTIGVFVRCIPLPSGFIAMSRGIVGTLFLLLVLVCKKQTVSYSAVRRNLGKLLPAGIAIGANWILLFEAYRYTTVATATLCYYLAPVFVLLASPLVFHEKMTAKKAVCVLVALAGMVLVSGIWQGGAERGSRRGIILGLGAAVLYSVIMLLSKSLRDISAYDTTIVQLGISAVIMTVYTLLTADFSELSATPQAIFMLLVVGIVHTGIAYALYFGAMQYLKAQTIALFSYIDPVVAILASALLLQEKMSAPSILGAACILGATLISELPIGKKAKSLS